MQQEPARSLRVVWVFDWFAYYAAGVLRSIRCDADVMVVTRDHGFELGRPEDPVAALSMLFPHAKHVTFVEGRQSDPRTLISALRARRQVREFKPDVIHSQDHSDWRLYLATFGLSAAKVVTVHDVVPHLGWSDPRNALQKAVESSVRSSADIVCVHGESLASSVRSQAWYRQQPTQRVPHGALSHAAQPLPLPQRPTVLFFGRLERYKGLEVFVEAVDIAANEIRGLRAIVAGQGESAAAAMKLPQSGAIEWRIGFVPDDQLLALFAESSVVVLPYLEASQSGVIPLAFANRRAVIATRVGALGETVSHGINGLLVEPGNARELAGAMITALGNRDLLDRLSAGAFESIESGGISSVAVAKAHIEAYCTAMRRGRRG